jgi:hypothetical protein
MVAQKISSRSSKNLQISCDHVPLATVAVEYLDPGVDDGGLRVF